MMPFLGRQNKDALKTTRSPLDVLGMTSLAIPGGGGGGGGRIVALGAPGPGVSVDTVGTVLMLRDGAWEVCDVETVGGEDATENRPIPFGLQIGMVGSSVQVLIWGTTDYQGTPGAVYFVGQSGLPVTSPPFDETRPTTTLTFNRFLGWQIDDETMAVMPHFQPWLVCRSLVCVDGEVGPVGLLRVPL
jgi:hypothetical protein